MITVTPQDALRSIQLTPGRKRGKVTGYERGTAKDGSVLHKYAIEVQEEGFPQYVPVQDYMISEKAISMGKSFFVACGMPEDIWDKLAKGEVTSNFNFDERECVGKELYITVINEPYMGRLLNKASDFWKKDW